MSQTKEDIERAKEILDKEYDWPSEYLFKFIVPRGKEHEIRDVFPYSEVKLRESSKGNYISVTVTLLMESSDAVLEVYKAASQIEGLISL